MKNAMLEIDDFSPNFNWLEAGAEAETEYSRYWASVAEAVSVAAKSNPVACNSVTNFVDVKCNNKTVCEKPVVTRRSRAHSKKTPTQHLNATAKNFKEMVQKYTGRPAVPRPLTLFKGSTDHVKGPMILSFGQANVIYEHYESDIVDYRESPARPLSGRLRTKDRNKEQMLHMHQAGHHPSNDSNTKATSIDPMNKYDAGHVGHFPDSALESKSGTSRCGEISVDDYIGFYDIPEDFLFLLEA